MNKMPTINDCESSESSVGSPTIITCTTPEMKMLQIENFDSKMRRSPVQVKHQHQHSQQNSNARSPKMSSPVLPIGTQNSHHITPTPPMNLPYKVIPPTCLGVSSPPGPRCYDIIEEELMFPLDEADHSHGNNSHGNKNAGRNHSLESETGSSREFSSLNSCSLSSSSVPKNSSQNLLNRSASSTTSSSFKSSSVTSSSCAGDSFSDRGRVISQHSLGSSVFGGCGSGTVNGTHCGLSPAASTNIVLTENGQNHPHHSLQHCSNGYTTPVSSSVSQSGAMACHYHTVHGHGQTYQAPSIIPPNGSDSPNSLFVGQCYRRNRSHSGPTYSPFTAQARHCAMISAGLGISPGSVTHSQPMNTPQTAHRQQCRRQSDDSDSRTSQSLKQRQSPGTSSGSFFDNFRPRSTSESKSNGNGTLSGNGTTSNKKPSVIAAIKNNLLNRTSVKNSTSGEELSSESSSSTGSTSSVAMSQSIPIDQSRNRQQQVSSPPPLSPGSVIDPFSLELGYARQQQALINHQEALFQQQLPSQSLDTVSGSVGSGTNRKSKFRSRTGSIGAAASAVFDMFRHRSNSIAVTDANEFRQHRKNSNEMSFPDHLKRHLSHSLKVKLKDSTNGVVKSNKDRSMPIIRKFKRKFFRSQSSQSLTIGHELSDHYEEILDENLVYARFFRFYRCYDIIPISAKLVVFDTKLVVKKAFFALLSNGVRAAPLWDSTKHEFVGMLTITDFILVLHHYHHSPNLHIDEIEKHTIENWRGMLKEQTKKLVHIQPDESLFSAIKMLITNHVHRLPVIDRDTENVLYIITHKRILKYLFLYYRGRLPMPSFMARTLRELPKIGTYDNIVVAKQDTPLIEALKLMVEKRISALPIVDKKNKVIDIYAKFDAIHLAADKAYQNLDIPIKKALEHRTNSEEVVTCTLDESLHTVLERTVNAEVHRSIVIDQDKGVIGIISLSDLLNFLVLRPAENEKPKLDTSLSLALPGIRNANIDGQAKSNGSSPSMIRSGATTPTTLKCAKVVEETPEEVLSAHSEESEPSSANGSQVDLLIPPKDSSSSSSNVSSSSSSGNINDTSGYAEVAVSHLNNLLTANGGQQNTLMVPSQ